MCQGIHTCRSCQSLWHRRHHLRIYDCDNRHVVRIYTDEFSLLLDISDNIVDRYLCCCSCCCRHCNDRNTWILGWCCSFQTSYIFEFRIGNDDTDCFGCIHRRSSADCDNIISSRFLKCLNSVLYILNRRIWFNVRI